MYLTRMKLNTDNRNVMRALVAPNLIHGAVESSFSGDRKRCLWRIDRLGGNTYLLLLSQERPDLRKAADQFGSSEWETISYEPLLERVVKGSQWHFRLVANPTISRSQGSGKRGKIYAHSSTRFQREWLLKKAEKHGFLIDEDQFDIKGSQWFRFRKKEGGHTVSLLQVTYEGILTVDSPELFKTMLKEGIGREKAYGMGLLTIVRV